MRESIETSVHPGSSRYKPTSATGTSNARSVIGPTLVIKGEITAEEDLLVLGTIEGSIEHDQTLTVHAQGTVRAAIKAREVIVEGTIEGDVFGTRRIKVCDTGRVIGNVVAPTVGVTEGAVFKGMIDMESDASIIEQRYAKLIGRQVKDDGKSNGPADEPVKAEVDAKGSSGKASGGITGKESGEPTRTERKDKPTSAQSGGSGEQQHD